MRPDHVSVVPYAQALLAKSPLPSPAQAPAAPTPKPRRPRKRPAWEARTAAARRLLTQPRRK